MCNTFKIFPLEEKEIYQYMWNTLSLEEIEIFNICVIHNPGRRKRYSIHFHKRKERYPIHLYQYGHLKRDIQYIVIGGERDPIYKYRNGKYNKSGIGTFA